MGLLMSFEVKDKDLLGRIGRLKTKSGTLETPLFFPVVNPVVQAVSPQRLRKEFGFEAVITNAYILKKRFEDKLVENCLHEFLGFDGVVMTDSGAYQILVYGDVDVEPSEIVHFQEHIGSDIATILDIPTGWNVSQDEASRTVQETLRRAKEFSRVKTRDDILWVGPVQGGRHLDLVAHSARQMGKLPFQIHALGSPTEVMERYRFDVLVDMIVTAKMNLPLERPLHLFGAGHPFMFALAVGLGCDLFDSAAYALFAKEGRYMTETGTSRLSELEYFPCACPKCAKTTPQQVNALPNKEMQSFLVEHNLHVCLAELKRVKQAIKENRLWEHMELRAHGHPSLLQAVRRLRSYTEFIERHDPSVKSGGLFFFDSLGLARPEMARYRRKLAENYAQPAAAKILVLVPQTRTKPFHKSREFKRTANHVQDVMKDAAKMVHICSYAAPFGVVPLELDEVYPLSQNEVSMPPDRDTADYVAQQLLDFIGRTDYRAIVLFNDSCNWQDTVLKACRRACRTKAIEFRCISWEEDKTRRALHNFARVLASLVE